MARPSGTVRGRAFSLLEVLLAFLIVGMAVAPMIGLFRSGRTTTESNVERVQAVYLAQKALEQVRREADVRFDHLVSVPAPAPLVASDVREVCYYFRRMDVFGHSFGDRSVFPFLYEFLREYRCAVEITPYEGMRNLKYVRVTVLFPRQARKGQMGTYTLETLLSRRSLF